MIEKATAEFEIEVSNGQITCEQVIPDGKCKLVEEVSTTTEDTTCHQRKGSFKLVRASELSLDDDFLKYRPKLENKKWFKRKVMEVIIAGVVDFWRPVCDPSFDDNGRICYELGKIPAVGKSYNWWEKNAKGFAPECGSRLGNESEYIAFLAVLIKELVDSGKSINRAWDAVCIDSNVLGNYCNSSNYKHGFEPTGSREVCGWCDLTNTFKFLAEDNNVGGLWYAGGTYYCTSANNPLARLHHSYERSYEDSHSCGWLVFDSCPDC